MASRLYQITLGSSCFGIMVQDGFIIQAAPVAQWALHKSWINVKRYYVNRKAKVVEIKQ